MLFGVFALAPFTLTRFKLCILAYLGMNKFQESLAEAAPGDGDATAVVKEPHSRRSGQML